ncbi:hypothetical protein, partial [Borreliella garinii]|uniref:hypothetical protein n=1 Tax=Borreliella garinii TaxID=29519 RepID=UPI001AED4764
GASVKGIAGGMKTIVEVAEKVEGVKFEPEKAVEAAAADNKNAMQRMLGRRLRLLLRLVGIKY